VGVKVGGSSRRPSHLVSRIGAVTIEGSPSMSGTVVISGILVHPLVREGRPGWRNGRRGALKMRCSRGRAGSSPAPGTSIVRPWPAMMRILPPELGSSEHGLNTFFPPAHHTGSHGPTQVTPRFDVELQVTFSSDLSPSLRVRSGPRCEGAQGPC